MKWFISCKLPQKRNSHEFTTKTWDFGPEIWFMATPSRSLPRAPRWTSTSCVAWFLKEKMAVALLKSFQMSFDMTYRDMWHIVTYDIWYLFEINRDFWEGWQMRAEINMMTWIHTVSGCAKWTGTQWCVSTVCRTPQVRCHSKVYSLKIPRVHASWTRYAIPTTSHNIKDDRKKVPLFAAGIYMYQLLRGLGSLYREGVVPNQRKLAEPIRFKTWKNSRCGSNFGTIWDLILTWSYFLSV